MTFVVRCANAPGCSCCIPIPQTAALLDLIPGTNYFDLFFSVYGPLNLLREGHKLPCKVNLRLLTVTLISLVVFSESPVANKTQRAPSRQKLLLWRHQQTPWDGTRLQLPQGPDLEAQLGKPEQAELLPQAGVGRGAKGAKPAPPLPRGRGCLAAQASRASVSPPITSLWTGFCGHEVMPCLAFCLHEAGISPRDGCWLSLVPAPHGREFAPPVMLVPTRAPEPPPRLPPA